MNAYYPDEEDSEESRIGTAVHELAATRISNKGIGLPCVGGYASNGVLLDDEAFECAEAYAQDVLSIANTRPHCVLSVEQHVKIPRVHNENSGTPDADLYDPVANELFIWDYKHGREIVEVYENWQLLDYASGLLDKYGIDGNADQQCIIHFRIVQPRAFHRDGEIREWKILGFELRNYTMALTNAANANFSDKAECKSGPHCKYCKARTGCEAAISAGMGIVEMLSQPTPLELSAEAMGLQYSIIQRGIAQLKSLEAGFEAQLTSRMFRGEAIPGWVMRDSFGREKFTLPYQEIVALGEMMGLDLRSETTVTPKQAIKLGMDEELVRSYSVTPKSGVTLKQVDPSRAKRTFL